MATEIVLFVRFGIAATVALLMRSLDHDGLATLGTPAISYVALLYMLLKRGSRRAFRHRRSGRGVSKVMRPAGDGPALKSAPIQQHRCVAHSIRNGGMPQEVLEPPVSILRAASAYPVEFRSICWSWTGNGRPAALPAGSIVRPMPTRPNGWLDEVRGRNFRNGVSRRDGTASLDVPRLQVPAFPRQD